MAISTCPNDTFAFHAILERKIDLQGIDFRINLLDISQLNEGLFSGHFDIAKASFHTALLLADKTVVLNCGSALGFGVGPLLLAGSKNSRPTVPSDGKTVTLCPGPHTTATLLMKLFYGDAIKNQFTQLKHVVFSDIMPMLQTGAAEFGVCIHEGRFTWQQQGLHLVEDLGSRWETETGTPLPLGGILARRTLAADMISRSQSVIRRSIEYGLKHREETLESMRKYAIEFTDDVLFQHVDLYVNNWTLDLGTVGRSALQQLSDKAGQLGIIAQPQPLNVWSCDH